jgi:hypothetical protein
METASRYYAGHDRFVSQRRWEGFGEPGSIQFRWHFLPHHRRNLRGRNRELRVDRNAHPA